MSSARGQAIGEHAARATGTDNDVVNTIHWRSLILSLTRAMPFRDSPMSFLAWKAPRRITVSNPVWCARSD
jgi:hypothetical protein